MIELTFKDLMKKQFIIVNEILIENNRFYIHEAIPDTNEFTGIKFMHYFLPITNDEELSMLHDYLQRLFLKTIEPFVNIRQVEHLLDHLSHDLTDDAKVIHTLGYRVQGTVLSYRISRRFQKSKGNHKNIKIGIISTHDNLITYNFSKA